VLLVVVVTVEVVGVVLWLEDELLELLGVEEELELVGLDEELVLLELEGVELELLEEDEVGVVVEDDGALLTTA